MSSATEETQRPADGASPPRPQVNWRVFIGAAAVSIAVTVWALIAPEQAQSVLGRVVAWTAGWFGWFYVLLVCAVLAFVIFLAVSKYGKIKLGPEHSKPEFGLLSWSAMLFAAGISTDLMFFAVAEPVTQYLQPPTGQPETAEAAHEGIAWMLFHYGVSGWGLYALMGMALAYFAYRMHKPLAIRSALAPIFGRRVKGAVGDAVDLAAVIGTVFGVATSLGIGVVMVNVGLYAVFGLPVGTAAQVGIVVVGVLAATFSAVSGVDKGIKILSLLNVFMAFALTLWVLIMGKTQFLLNALVANIGDFIRLFPQMAMETFPYQDTGTWMSDWTLFFWAWWITFASFVGLFLARISRGRTIRQFVLGTLIIPFLYILMWASIYGNSALNLVRSGDEAFGEATLLQPEGAFYELLSRYPAYVLVAAVATATALLFYVTTADSAALVMANLSSHLPNPEHDARPGLRIFWALITGALTVSMLIVGGIGALQSATVIMGLPFAFVLVFVMIGLYRALRVETFRLESAEQSLSASLSGRATSSRGAAYPWRRRLSRVLAFADDEHVQEFKESVLLPSLAEVVEELQQRGVDARCGSVEGEGDSEIIELEVDGGGQHPFHYDVRRRHVPAPSFGQRMPRGKNTYVRLEVYVDGGTGQGYDIMGYTKDQLIDDVLDQYERHVGFLQIQEINTHGTT